MTLLQYKSMVMHFLMQVVQGQYISKLLGIIVWRRTIMLRKGKMIVYNTTEKLLACTKNAVHMLLQIWLYWIMKNRVIAYTYDDFGYLLHSFHLNHICPIENDVTGMYVHTIQ
jgi:hypothetical protein